MTTISRRKFLAFLGTLPVWLLPDIGTPEAVTESVQPVQESATEQAQPWGFPLAFPAWFPAKPGVRIPPEPGIDKTIYQQFLPRIRNG